MFSAGEDGKPAGALGFLRGWDARNLLRGGGARRALEIMRPFVRLALPCVGDNKLLILNGCLGTSLWEWGKLGWGV